MTTLPKQETTNIKKNIISSTEITFEPFKNEVDPIDLLTLFDGFIHEIKASPDENTIKRIKQQLAGYQVILIDHGDQERWITAPMSLHNETFRNSMPHRIWHLLKSGGNWKHETVEKERIDVHSYTVPITIPVTNEIQHGIMDESVTSFAVVIGVLHKMFTKSLEKGETIGVFKTPYGITNMNRLKAEITDYERYGTWDVKNTLKTRTLDQIVESASFIVKA